MHCSQRLVTLILLFLASGCAGSLRHLRVMESGSAVPCPGPQDRPVEVTFLRTAGVLFRRGERDVLMTAPFYSNPSLFRVLLGLPIQASPSRIRDQLPPVSDAKAILVGHAHYDHLLDVPEIALHRAQKAILYGSSTTTHLLAPFLPAQRLRSVDAEVAGADHMGEWIHIPDTRIRILPLRSQHAPHLLRRVKVFGGSVPTPLQEPACNAYHWREGQTLAYLIDFLSEDGERVEYRIHYRDAASNEPYGQPPPLTGKDDHPVDLLVLCVASFDQVDDYPQWVIRNLKPRHILLSHWEDFFRPPDWPLAAVPLTDTAGFAARLPSDVGWTTLAPGASMTCTDSRGNEVFP